jgi:hypothetical protein
VKPIGAHRWSIEMLIEANEALIDGHRSPIEAHRPIEVLSKVLWRPIAQSRPYRVSYRGPSRPLSTPIEPYRRPIGIHRGFIEAQRGPYRRPSMPYRSPSPYRGPIEGSIEAHRGSYRCPSMPYQGPHRSLSRLCRCPLRFLLKPIEAYRGLIEIPRGFIEPYRGPPRLLSTAIEALSRPIAPSRPIDALSRPYRDPSKPLCKSNEIDYSNVDQSNPQMGRWIRGQSINGARGQWIDMGNRGAGWRNVAHVEGILFLAWEIPHISSQCLA